MTNERPVLLWVEDRELTVENQIAQAKRSGFIVETRATPQDVLEVLSSGQVAGIVVDIMLWGVANLSAIQLDANETDTRDGLYAGWILIDKIFRAPKSPYADIPVMVLSSHTLGEEGSAYLRELRARPGGTIDYAEKGTIGLTDRFSHWFENLTGHAGGRRIC